MRILLFGKNGQVGWELQRALAPLGEVIALSSNSTEYHADFLEPEKLSNTIHQINPNIIVNAAAYTAVDKAESDKDSAQKVNADSVAILAKTAQNIGAWLIHYSTDYVFNGSGEKAWQENDIPEPLSTYGRTKLVGENAIIKNCNKYLIFRTSWVYANKGSNFAKTMLTLGKKHSQLSVINDQFGAPTSAELLADCTAHAIRVALQDSHVAGLYHLTASGTTTWYEYAKLVFDEAQKLQIDLTIENIIPIATTEYPLPAKRPHNSRLNTNKFEKTFGLKLPDWKIGIIRMIDETTIK
ncbi:dTDP-4-dehydrorhamnose reductase [Xenorhabdus beddingii]|uniref:dTDP-4-dehydrorhamnose reductase n=1 Tax=Xenorhabdus beddingii TaxID=40578 RepID=A0A1Y2SM13_9GAMM|nr:dTDP-4-dehydrorhamnose reductase [Xenorhabdus beddingii]OTA19164.1 dTDP-4-dehydrorhamnose reductase [Xenorhabdus beddingii]